MRIPREAWIELWHLSILAVLVFFDNHCSITRFLHVLRSTGISLSPASGELGSPLTTSPTAGLQGVGKFYAVLCPTRYLTPGQLFGVEGTRFAAVGESRGLLLRHAISDPGPYLSSHHGKAPW